MYLLVSPGHMIIATTTNQAGAITFSHNGTVKWHEERLGEWACFRDLRIGRIDPSVRCQMIQSLQSILKLLPPLIHSAIAMKLLNSLKASQSEPEQNELPLDQNWPYNGTR